MNRLFLALAISTALTAPAFADTMAADVTCSAFMAMGHDDQMGAMTAGMEADKMAADGAMATDTTTTTAGDAMAAAPAMSADEEMAAMVAACTAHPDMMAMDAMHMMK
ncbi:MAG: hypothetical protein ABI832_18370 [bacterium]